MGSVSVQRPFVGGLGSIALSAVTVVVALKPKFSSAGRFASSVHDNPVLVVVNSFAGSAPEEVWIHTSARWQKSKNAAQLPAARGRKLYLVVLASFTPVLKEKVTGPAVGSESDVQ